MSFVLSFSDDVRSGKIVEIARTLEDIGVGESIDIMLLNDIVEVGVTVEDNISEFIDFEYIAELLDSMVGFELE